MRSFLLLVFFLGLSFSVAAQITGTVTNPEGKPLPFVNIYLEGKFTGTTTNEAGYYELEVSQSGNYNVVFQFLGYKTELREIEPESFPTTLNVTLTEESTRLNEVVVDAADNPANRIIRNAIAERQRHKARLKAYTADFYSRGIWRLKDAPDRILGQEIGNLGGILDSTQSGIIYLSETISEIAYRAPDDFKEKIIASKVSGNDNGFSLNSAREATISFYNNTISLNNELISPLADYAFNYYNFKLDGAFYNDRGDLINKIEVRPKRPADKVFSGFVYIVEDSWQIYGIELATNGKAMQVPPIEELEFRQQFNYSGEIDLWVPISQTVDFSFGMFGIKGNGRFTAVYTNYDFNPRFERRSFGREIVSFTEDANEKDSLYWQQRRRVPLTSEERNDYQKKDSLQELRNSRTWLDSVDRVQNSLEITDLLTGYTYQNSYENWVLNISSPIFNTSVNTVQGYNTSLDINFRKNKKEVPGTYWNVFSEFSYGFSEDKLRATVGYRQQFNNISKPVLTIAAGSSVRQINDREPISPMLNSLTTFYFERNYLKLFELDFLRLAYRQELFNGFDIFSQLSAEKRSPLYNQRLSPFIDWDDRDFTSNNPLQPHNHGSAPFEEHRLFRFSVSAEINFAQEYLSYPHTKFNIPNEKYPRLRISFEKGFGANREAYSFDHLELGLRQEFSVGTIGRFGYNLMGGTFFNDNEVSFIDHRHFNGNQTRIGTASRYLSHFNLLPYYARSTATDYTEAHLEHDFEGWILGKIPFVNRLNFSLVTGAHALMTEDEKPYTEYSLGFNNVGFGKFRFMRVDYVVSAFEGRTEGAFIFGLKFLNIL